MEATKEIKELLLEEFGHIAATSANLIRKITPELWDYRPRDNMRSMLELAQHLVSLPSVDLLILQENGEPAIRGREAEITACGPDADKLIGWMTSGLEDVKAYMEALSEEDFLHRKTKPFYLEHGSVQAKWLIEMVTHAQHHRAQLFQYLKQSGVAVNMFDLY